MVQSTHDCKSDHLYACILRGRNQSALFGELLPNPLMGSCSVEVDDIRIQDPLELLFLKNQQMVKAFLPDTPQEALADRISSWGMNWRFDDLDRARFRYPSKARPELAIVIPNQVLGGEPIRGRFPQLLSHPGIGRRACHTHVDHLARLQFYDEERKEWPKEEISDLQEVTRPDLSCVVAEKRAPLLPTWRLCANRPHVLLDGALADPNAQFQ
jgi:hypothetical protein